MKQIKCNSCAIVLDEEDKHINKVREVFTGYHDSVNTLFYCPLHEQKYDEVHYSNSIYNPITYYKRIEVDYGGNPIGYKPIKDK